MRPSRDAFGFTTSTPAPSRQGNNPIIVVAQPGQEVRVVIADDGAVGGRSQKSADSGQASSPSGKGDSGQASSPSGKGDSGQASSPSGKGDSGQASSPSGKGDIGLQDPFGFKTFPRGFSPSPIKIIAHAGQEIRIVVPDQTGSSNA